MANDQQKSFPADPPSPNDRSGQLRELLAAQIAALRQRIAEMTDAVIDDAEPAPIFRTRKDLNRE